MATSIFHRVTGNAMAFVGLLLFAAWLATAATSREAYQGFTALATSPLGWLVWVGFSWVFFQHLMSGLRHLFMDTGRGLEIHAAKFSATVVFVGAAVLTAGFWALMLMFGPGAI